MLELKRYLEAPYPVPKPSSRQAQCDVQNDLRHMAPLEIKACLRPYLDTAPQTDVDLNDPIVETFANHADILICVAKDLAAYIDRDPSTTCAKDVIDFSKGFHCSLIWRLSRFCKMNGAQRRAQALHYIIQDRFACDLHPDAEIGPGLMLDHCFSIVVGSTARAGHSLTLYHGATLGARHIVTGDRHPKLGHGVLVGCGAKILGNIQIGDNVRVGAGSVVLDDIPANSTVSGEKATV